MFTPRLTRAIPHPHDPDGVKIYTISADGTDLEAAPFFSQLQLLKSERQLDWASTPAFAIFHKDAGQLHLVLAWWQNGHELLSSVSVRNGDRWVQDPTRYSFDLWDLEIFWYERNSFMRHLCSGSANLAGYRQDLKAASPSPVQPRKALLVIDVQNDYFPGGKLPLWNTAPTLHNIERAVRTAKDRGIPVILIQHLTDPKNGAMFNPGTEGAAIHPSLRAAAPDAPIVPKTRADAFYETALEKVLSELGVTTLLVCGMMTQNCVTHTAISKAAEQYEVLILPDCCTTVSELVHTIALRAVSTRLNLLPSPDALP
jgi:nicotinamidase-related amidase